MKYLNIGLKLRLSTIARLIMTIIILSSFASGLIVHAEEDSDISYADTTMVYFYIDGCKECKAVKEYMGTMSATYNVDYNGQEVYSVLKLVPYDIGTPEGLEAMYAYYEEYDVPEDRQFVPSIFIGDKHLLGEVEVKNKLVKHIEAGHGLVEETVTQEMIAKASKSVTLSGKNIAGVLVTGLINGLNPCSISMILFLFSLLLTRKVNVLKLGLAFVFGKFVTYVLLGSVFYNLLITFDIDWVNTAIKVLLVIVFLTISILNFLDFFAAKNERYGKIKMQLPAKLRKMNHNVIKKMTDVKNQKKLLVLCFVLGAIISVGEFLCTGQIYLATIVYVLQNSSVFDMKAFVYLVLYSTAFIVPLTIITIAVHKSKAYFNLSELVRGKMHLIKLINAIVFLVFVIVVILLF